MDGGVVDNNLSPTGVDPTLSSDSHQTLVQEDWSARNVGKVHSMHWSLRACCGIRCVENVCYYVHRCAMKKGQVRCCCVHFGTFV